MTGAARFPALSIGGLSTSFQRDDSGMLTSVTDPNGGRLELYARWRRPDRIESDPLKRSTSYSYDSRNRVAGIQTPMGTVALTYDAGGNLTRASIRTEPISPMPTMPTTV